MPKDYNFFATFIQVIYQIESCDDSLVQLPYIGYQSMFNGMQMGATNDSDGLT